MRRGQTASLPSGAKLRYWHFSPGNSSCESSDQGRKSMTALQICWFGCAARKSQPGDARPLTKASEQHAAFRANRRNRCAKLGARSLDPPQEDEDENDDEDQPEAARRIVAPAGAIGPGRQRADENKNQDNQQNGSEHGHLPSFVSPDFSVACTLSSVSYAPVECSGRRLTTE